MGSIRADVAYRGLVSTDQAEEQLPDSVNESSGNGGEDDGTSNVVVDDVNEVRLQREISLGHAVAVMTGVMIGSGIFVSPVSVVFHCGSVGLSLIVWVLSGVVMLFMALSFTELGCMFPAAGAEYAYYKAGIGNLPAFLQAWYQFVLADPAFFALLSLTTTIYLSRSFTDCEPPMSVVKIISILIMVVIAFLNCVYVRYVMRVQSTLVAIKFAALIGIVVVGLIQLVWGRTDILATGFEGSTSNPGAVAIAMYSGIFTYGGWQYCFALVEEVRHPERVVPRAVVISFILVICIYLASNVAYFTVLTPEHMLQSNAVAVTFFEQTFPVLAVIIPFFVACSTIGALNGSILGGSRIYFAAARDRLFPTVMSLISIKYKTPLISVITTCAFTCLYILTGDAVALMEYIGFTASFSGFIAVSLVIYLRWADPHRARPFKVALIIPIVTSLTLLALCIMGLIHKPAKNGIGILLVMTGIPIYFYLNKWKSKPECLTKKSEAFVMTVQRILMAVPQDDAFK